MDSSGKFAAPDVSETGLRYLEMIQACIARMATNSFLLKGWTVTLATGLFVLSSHDTEPAFSLVALLPAVVFWSLDAFYMGRERLFRRLYEQTVAGLCSEGRDAGAVALRLDTSHLESSRRMRDGLRELFARTVWPVHLAVILVILAVFVLR
jgi:hypothetical protein